MKYAHHPHHATTNEPSPSPIVNKHDRVAQAGMSQSSQGCHRNSVSHATCCKSWFDG